MIFALFRPTWYAFAGMWANAFIIMIEDPLLRMTGMRGSNMGNFGFWFNFCIIGQPMILLMYYINFMKEL